MHIKFIPAAVLLEPVRLKAMAAGTEQCSPMD